MITGKRGREIVGVDVGILLDTLNEAFADEWLTYYQYWIGSKVTKGPVKEVEINIPALESMAVGKEQPRQYVQEYRLSSGRTIRLLAEGRLVNLAAAEGHPSAVMDMSFANQALCAAFIYKNKSSLENKVHPVPDRIDQEIACMKLDAMKICIDTLTEEQAIYLSSWREGT
jgi:adenosylhomocysteinase